MNTTSTARHVDTRPRRQGLTLIEILIFLGLMAVIVATVVSMYGNSAVDSQVSVTAQDLQTIAKAAIRFHGAHGDWPSLTDETNAPGDFTGYLPAEAFQKPSPISAATSSYCWCNDEKGVRVFVRETDKNKAKRVDELIDDGDPQSGSVRVDTASGGLNFWVRRP